MAFLQELEQIEESWRKETKDLYENVAHLQDENRKLRNAVQEHEGHSVKYKGTGFLFHTATGACVRTK